MDDRLLSINQDCRETAHELEIRGNIESSRDTYLTGGEAVMTARSSTTKIALLEEVNLHMVLTRQRL